MQSYLSKQKNLLRLHSFLSFVFLPLFCVALAVILSITAPVFIPNSLMVYLPIALVLIPIMQYLLLRFKPASPELIMALLQAFKHDADVVDFYYGCIEKGLVLTENDIYKGQSKGLGKIIQSNRDGEAKELDIHKRNVDAMLDLKKTGRKD